MDVKPYLQKVTLQADRIASYSDFPFNIPAIKNLPNVKFHSDVTFIVGENGSGKSTFIEAIAECLGLSQEGGSKHLQFRSKATSLLADHLLITKSHLKPKDYFFLRAESLYNVASHLEGIYENDRERFAQIYGVNSLHECSHGESFLAVMASRLGGDGLYIFDEPEAALSPSHQLTALNLIEGLVRKNSQFVIATHSPILLAYPGAFIYQFDETGVRQISYEETESFMVTKSFLNNYRFMIDRLFKS
jgi:predicted ATPase